MLHTAQVSTRGLAEALAEEAIRLRPEVRVFLRDPAGGRAWEYAKPVAPEIRARARDALRSQL